jgi:hypothetical protein
MRLRPNELPRAVFAGEIAADSVGAIVIFQPDNKIVRLADVKTAGWILKNVCPIHGDEIGSKGRTRSPYPSIY